MEMGGTQLRNLPHWLLAGCREKSALISQVHDRKDVP